MKVKIPHALQSYTKRESEVNASGPDLEQLFDSLEQQFPGIRFRMIDELGRMRPHIKVFLNGQLVREQTVAVYDDDEVQIVQALSGG